MVNYDERFHLEDECFDTIWDIFTHDVCQKALKRYKKEQKKNIPDASYKGITQWELLREIFSQWESTSNTELFLRCLKKELFNGNKIPDIRFVTALILSIQWVKWDINDGPSSIKEIVSEKVLTVISSSKAAIIYEDNNENIFYQYDGIRNSLESSYPCITKTGKIVYYLHWWKDGRICVWDEEEKEELWIDIDGEVLDEEGIKKLDAAYGKKKC